MSRQMQAKSLTCSVLLAPNRYRRRILAQFLLAVCLARLLLMSLDLQLVFRDQEERLMMYSPKCFGAKEMRIMYKRTAGLLLMVALVNFVWAESVAGYPQSKVEKRAARIKAQISKLGTGPDARIGVELQDKTELVGYVSETADDHFVIVDNTSSVRNVMYLDVTKIHILPTSVTLLKKDVHSGGFFKKVAIAVGVIAGTAVVICVVSKRCD